MNNQEVGYVFAEKFNNEDVSYGTGYNQLRGKGYSASFANLVFADQFYGDPQYGGAEYGGDSNGYYIRWIFTSSLDAPLFYERNPSILRDEVLLTLYQNYIPTGSSGDPSRLQYSLYIPLSLNNLPFPPSAGSSYFNVSGEYYLINTGSYTVGSPNVFSISTGSGFVGVNDSPATTAAKVSQTIYAGSNNFSASFAFTASFTDPQIVFNIRRRALITGSILVLRNLKITYPVDATIFEPFAQTQDLHLQTSAGMINARYEGSKMTSPDFNIDSPDTIDGGPVVTVTTVNPKSPVRGDTVPKQKISRSVKNTDSVSSLTGKGNFKIK